MTPTISIDSVASVLQCETVLDDSPLSSNRLEDVSLATRQALSQPIDFPELKAAVVPGDHVVLAVDPNVPQLTEVIAGVVIALGETDAGQIDIVVWDEASEQTLQQIKAEVSPGSRVVQHQGSSRRDLRYLAADPNADPVYLNRLLVDADLVLPIIPARVGTRSKTDDLSGIYPALVDSASRIRHQQRLRLANGDDPNLQTGWLLGVQMMVCVIANREGAAAEVCAGTAIAIDERLRSLSPTATEDPQDQRGDMVIAAISGPQHVQTWANAARAASAAGKFANEDATIVLWTEIDQHPTDTWVQPEQERETDQEEEQLIAEPEGETEPDEDFPAWNPASEPARQIAAIAEEHRLLLHSRLDGETVESIGLGVIDSVEEISRLSRGFSSALLIRAAQYQG